ncbi:hypothetical protein K493DRAFT_301719 [Basidiobolus meristosporus CBS 931.73]|uniref:Uncharacterized protein n=1 Tax=Basidiobolus meristosporus CBS 931.73 TaxID=1314790 RepID=A0A1Y1YAB9_9FUNG|nr:hypothetical protein K493DRAFT_301719 [Basidiobolus meristosporus CBS 931.73]|eukprot:ORX94969.1 hypothetical protein K493DRAFT_301719 [Basidiobolus meristosporus CBS 931.73]
MLVENSPICEKQSPDLFYWLDAISPQLLLDQEGRRRLTVRFRIKEYNPDNDWVAYEAVDLINHRFHHNSYFQAPRISEIKSQDISLTSNINFLRINQGPLGSSGKNGIWKFSYSITNGEYEDERWIVPLRFECQLKFLVNPISKSKRLSWIREWFRRQPLSTYLKEKVIQVQNSSYHLLSPEPTIDNGRAPSFGHRFP